MNKPSRVTILFLSLAGGLGIAFLLGGDPAAQSPVSGSPDAMLERAERLVAEGSYALAHEIYLDLDARDLPEDRTLRVDFRVADTLWRSEAATKTADGSRLEQARQALETMVNQAVRTEDRDLTWAEATESLGDFWWTRRDARNWGQGWPYYEKALDWWAGSREIEAARERYLAIVWKAARPPRPEPYYEYGYFGNQIPLQVLEDALRIADDPTGRARASYLIAMTLRRQRGNERLHRRTEEAFQAALEQGLATQWYDDALFHYAEWLTGSGQVVRTETGVSYEPDFVRALVLYRRLVTEFEKGETRYHDQARSRIEGLTRPTLGLTVSRFYLPGSEIQYDLSWRNVSTVRLRLYQVELTRDLRFADRSGSGDWLQRIDLLDRDPLDSWSVETEDRGIHVPGRKSSRLDRELPAGAYVLEASAAGETARDLILVSRASVVFKTSGARTLVYLCDALDGSPWSDGEVVAWIRHRDDRQWRWQRVEGRSDDNGLTLLDLPTDSSNFELFVAASRDGHQAFGTGHNWIPSRATDDWRVYVFTDRPAYRPGEEVQWKLVARQHAAGSYTTPRDASLEYEIKDPRGAKVEQGELRLNRFGSAWASFEAGQSLPLGEYRIAFREPGSTSVVGSAVLFRLEEYKLPEFKVSVEVPEQDGKPRVFRVGDTVEADVVAAYYFGGPVADASVEVVVYQRPLNVWWRPPREFPWFYSDMDPGRSFGWYGPGQLVQREALHTDVEGRATISFDTPANASQDFEYTIEARVTDASRREILGRGTVRVSRQRYFAFADAGHVLYRPGDQVRVEIKTIDANELPFRADGRITVTRDRWAEVWVDPTGREVLGDKLEQLKRREQRFPPPPSRPGDPPWRLEFEGYRHEEILTRLVRTGEDGLAEIDFEPAEPGYYRVSWRGDEREPYPVNAETTVWVADRDTTVLGYRHGGVQILVDRDTVRVGRRAPVMLSVPTRDSYVLFSIEGEELYDHRLVHVTGTVKLLELEIEEWYVPNVFLEAAMVRDAELSVDSRQLVVPPVQNFLEVEVQASREEYRPGEKGTLEVTTRDHDGNPVPAEVALALVDESVFYIQQDVSGDPRQFFFGTKRGKRVRTQNSFQQKAYADLVQEADGGWRDRLSGERRKGEDAEGLAQPSVRYMADEMGAAGAAKKSRASVAEAELAEEAVRAPSAAAPADADAGAEPAVQVRSDFRSTALWLPDVVTDADGSGQVEVNFPDSLTTWKATARVATTGNRFGMAEATTRTSKPLIVRLQAPRFFVVGDTVTVSAVINNNTDGPHDVTSSLDAAGVEISGLLLDGRRTTDLDASVTVPAHGEVRVDWLVEVPEAGTARLRVAARGAALSDAMERSYLVYEHGVEKLLARSGKVRGDEVRVGLDLPAERRPGSTTMTVQVTPSLAVTMLDALPYLIDYPYGCTEQTMSRFLPAAITARTLESLGLKPEAIAGRIFGGIEPEHAGKTHTREAQDLDRLDEMVDQGLQRLYDFQHADGGWGWWKEGDSDPFMTAYVVWGLGIVRDAGVRVDRSALRRGAEFLDRELVEEENRLDRQAWMLHALASLGAKDPGQAASRFQRVALDNLWDKRDGLNAYGRALLALSAHYYGDDERAVVLVRNLVNGVKRDRSPDTSVVMRGDGASSDAVIGTAHWGEDGLYWRWSEGGVEATAFALRALLAVDPRNELIEPVTNWLIKNRRGAQWSNTRDTAITVLSLVDYLVGSGELGADLEYELSLNGRTIATERILPADVIDAPSRFTIDPGLLRDGANEIRIVRRGGDGPIYFAAEARFFSLEEPVTPAGNEIFVRRQYHELVGYPTLLKGYVYEKQPLGDEQSLTSGDRVEVVVTVEAKNDYEYLVFEDLKPAGLEAVELRSGQPLYARQLKASALGVDDGAREAEDYTGRTRWVYQELRDRKVVLFIDKLPEGVWEMRYELRAETPGTFHALPVLGHAMYVPEIRCNGAEVRIEVLDRE